MSDPTIDREIEQNEARTVRDDARDEATPSLTQGVEDVMSTFARPLASDREDSGDTAKQRVANDAEQREQGG